MHRRSPSPLEPVAQGGLATETVMDLVKLSLVLIAFKSSFGDPQSSFKLLAEVLKFSSLLFFFFGEFSFSNVIDAVASLREPLVGVETAVIISFRSSANTESDPMVVEV